MFNRYHKLIITYVLITTGANVYAQQLDLPLEPEYHTTPSVCSRTNTDDKPLCEFINNISTSLIEKAALLNYANEVNSISGLKTLNVPNVMLYEKGIQIAADCYKQTYRGDIAKYGRIVDFVRRNALTTNYDKIIYAKYTGLLNPLTITYRAPSPKECAYIIKNNKKYYK